MFKQAITALAASGAFAPAQAKYLVRQHLGKVFWPPGCKPDAK
jgi:hypothetical protein